jgi:hypothetical protein
MSYEVEKDWITQAGLRAVVIYITDMGHRCGYVGVNPGHPLHGAEYSKPHPALLAVSDDEPIGKRSLITLLAVSLADTDRMQSPDIVFDVHGGLTYSGGDGKYPVAADLWWFGYDCAHAGDARDPRFLESVSDDRQWLYESYDGVLRTLDYCTNECESLARQITAKTQTRQPLDVARPL